MLSKPDFAKKQIVFVFTTQGERVSFSNDNIVVKDSEGKVKHQSTCYRLFLLCIVGETSITSGLLQRAHRFGFTICLFNRSMKLYEELGGHMEGNTILHKKQYEYDGLGIGKHIIINKISNQANALRRIRHRPDSTNETIATLNDYVKRIQTDELDLQQLLGLEGLAARVYFRELFLDLDWTGRKPRIKADYINSTLDVGYTVLFNFMDAMLRVYGFDTYYGVLHKQFYMRKSLVCDLVEPFRPLIDWRVRTAIHLGQCISDDFEVANRRYLVAWKKSSKYTMLFAKAIMDEKLDIFDYVRDYYRSVMKGKSIDLFPMFEWA